MDLKKVLTRDVVEPDLQGETKQEIIQELLEILMKTGKVTDRGAALEALLDREKKMSTGIQYGVAIPHAKTDTVDELIACVGIKKEGVDFTSLDEEPAKIFIMTLSPNNKTGPHVQFLAEISKVLTDEDSRRKLLEADTAEKIVSIIC